MERATMPAASAAPGELAHADAGGASEIELSVVVPVLNEREALPELIDEIERACARLPGSFEVVVVDDGSTDGSVELLEQLAAERRVVLVKLRRNFGKAAALREGFRETRGRVVVTLDGDGQDDPAEIPALVAKLGEGFDLVSGWKHERNDPGRRRLASRFFNRVTARLSGVHLHDFNCGLKAYRGDYVRSLDLYGELHRFIPVIGAQRGWRIAELPVNHRPRKHGRSRYGLERYARGLLDLMNVLFIGRYQNRPIHLFGGIGLLLMLAGFIMCAYLAWIKIGGEAIGDRPLLLLGVLLIVVGIQLLTLGLISEMVAAARQDIRGPSGSELQVDRVVRGEPRATDAP
ncbi:MAG TPA: glycosyltransferase family 2 protein [Thermoleophilaceae bacterium]|nr:glycosyltransferase family 2 protein [Thermoleophilaceae bacterium]